MTKTLLRAGVEIDIPSKDEIREQVDEALRMRVRERAKKRIELMIPVQPAAATFYAPGPAEGYVWSLKLVGVNLASAGNCTVYKASSTGDTRRPLGNQGNVATVQGFTWSADQARLRHGEGLYVTTSTTLTGLYLVSWQVPAELEAEIYD